MTWTSYFVPLTIYQNKTARGTLIEVREHYGGRELYLDGYPQTQKRYRQDWAKILKKIPAGKTLLLGLGGGDIVKLLRKNEITAVELESEVVSVARDYFGINPSEKLKIVTEDAERYIMRNAQHYDLIVVDLYSGDEVPEFVETLQFLKYLKGALVPRGTLIINYASHSFGKIDFEKFETKLKRVFGNMKRQVVWGHTFYVVQK